MNNMHGIIFSYEKYSGLGDLVGVRAHGSVPFAGDYRMVDFVLSNMINGGIHDVGVIMHGKCQSLLGHLGSGKNWDLSRKVGGLSILPAYAYHENTSEAAEFRGEVEALGSVYDYLSHIRQDYVVLSDAISICNVDLKDVLAQHVATGADITIIGTKTPGLEDENYIKVDQDGRVKEVYFERDDKYDYRGIHMCIIGTELLRNLVQECVSHGKYSFKRDVLQARVNELNIRVYEFTGYVARISNTQQYFEESMKILDSDIRKQVFREDRPIYGKENDASSTFMDPDTVCVNSMISDGCDIRGTVRNSIISREVKIEKGAEVENCVLFKNTVVKSGCILKNVIADKNVVFSENTTLIGHEKYPVVLAKGSIV